MTYTFAQSAGMIQGGWGYVIASYVFTWLFFVGYAVSLYTRGREES